MEETCDICGKSFIAYVTKEVNICIECQKITGLYDLHAEIVEEDEKYFNEINGDEL